MTQHTTDLRRPEALQRALSVYDGVELSISDVCERLDITARTARYYEPSGVPDDDRAPADTSPSSHHHEGDPS